MLEGSIQIMSKAGTGTAMFSMGEWVIYNGHDHFLNLNCHITLHILNWSGYVLIRLFIFSFSIFFLCKRRLTQVCIHICRYFHGTSGEVDCLWTKHDLNRFGFKVHCGPSGYGNWCHRCRIARWRFASRNHSGSNFIHRSSNTYYNIYVFITKSVH